MIFKNVPNQYLKFNLDKYFFLCTPKIKVQKKEEIKAGEKSCWIIKVN